MMLSALSSRGRARLVALVAQQQQRGFATVRKNAYSRPIAQRIIDNLPAVPQDDDEPAPEPQYSTSPVTSAHAIDTKLQKVSMSDSAAISPSGAVVHGTYGELGSAAAAIPLEYLALLRPAAEGAAAVRVTTGNEKGTVLVYGASEANGLAAVQLASTAGNAVVAVVGHEHSANELMMDCIKGLVGEPGTVVPDVFALSKKNFLDLVNGISSGDEGIVSYTGEEYLEDFRENLLEYVATYPEDFPAAVDPERFKFLGMEKDREHFRANMEAYLAQYNPGSPQIDRAMFDARFTKEQYEVFRGKFWSQTTNVISGDRLHFFSPPHIVKELIEEPEELDTMPGGMPYSFSILNQSFPEDSASQAGGPVLGAIIAVTPDLEVAATAVHEAKTLREKGEALQFLTSHQRTAFGAACSVAAVAKKNGAPVYAMGGSLPGLESVEPSDSDVQEALAAMDIDDAGNSRLNFFVQVYRACDFPFYNDYAIHRATEKLAGPRQIIVAK